MTFANNSLIALKKTLRILFISKILNFFCLFIMFKISFLIICKNDFIVCSYSKFFMLLKSVCNFFKKTALQHVYFFLCHESSISSEVVVKQHCCFRTIMQLIKYLIFCYFKTIILKYIMCFF